MNIEELLSTDNSDVSILDAGIADERTTRQKYVDSVRAYADFIEAHPLLALPSTQRLYVFPSTGAMATYAHEMGKCRKSACDSYFNLTRDFLPAIQYEPTWYRNQVCERVVVGQEEVTENIVEVVGTRKVTKDVVEWKCPKVLQSKELENA